MIEESIGEFTPQNRLIEQVQAALLKGPKRSCQISAIYGGNEERRKRLKRLRVVPVVKMPAMPWHFADGAERMRCFLHKFSRSQIAKFACHLTHIQKKSDICRRNARGDFERLFLNVVRNEPVVLFSTELRKIPAGTDRCAPKEESVFFRNLGLRHECRAVEPFRYKLAARPEHQHWHRGNQSRPSNQKNNEPKQNSNNRHPVQVSIHRSTLGHAGFGFSGCFPFEQTLPSKNPPD